MNTTIRITTTTEIIETLIKHFKGDLPLDTSLLKKSIKKMGDYRYKQTK